jgi:lipopolysaccharide export system protein LptC
MHVQLRLCKSVLFSAQNLKKNDENVFYKVSKPSVFIIKYKIALWEILASYAEIYQKYVNNQWVSENV